MPDGVRTPTAAAVAATAAATAAEGLCGPLNQPRVTRALDMVCGAGDTIGEIAEGVDTAVEEALVVWADDSACDWPLFAAKDVLDNGGGVRKEVTGVESIGVNGGRAASGTYGGRGNRGRAAAGGRAGEAVTATVAVKVARTGTVVEETATLGAASIA